MLQLFALQISINSLLDFALFNNLRVSISYKLFNIFIFLAIIVA
jgi:hypothetical protein